MRNSAAVMEKHAAEQSAKSRASVTAKGDLKTYEKFSQPHVQGLKSLTLLFDVLYQTMQDAHNGFVAAILASGSTGPCL